MQRKPLFLRLDHATKEMVVRRNYLCPEYEKCLNQAAYSDSDLDCSGCLFREKRHLDADFPDACQAGCRALQECTFY